MERTIYASDSPAVHNQTLMAKCNVRKEQGLYEEALRELSRIYTYALSPEESDNYYSQKALLLYLAAHFEEALATITEARYYTTSTDALTTLALIEALAAGQLGRWEESHKAALTYAAAQPQGDLLAAEIDALYNSTPKLRNPQLAWWLSMIPGVGQFYAGGVRSVVISLLVNGALAYFGVSEMVAGQWLSGWIVGCGGLSTTYFVGQERARQLTVLRNRQLLYDYNASLRNTLLPNE